MIDVEFYKSLLSKYMDYVGWLNGTDFLNYRDKEQWTDEEWVALQKSRRVVKDHS